MSDIYDELLNPHHPNNFSFAAKLDGAGLHAMAETMRTNRPAVAADLAERREADEFAWGQIHNALADGDIAHANDGFRFAARAEVWARHEEVRDRGTERRFGVGQGVRLVGVDGEGITARSPLDPRTPPSWAVLHAPTPNVLYLLEPDNLPKEQPPVHLVEPENVLRSILAKRLSVYSGYSGNRVECEFSSSVEGVDRACTCASRGLVPEPGCCTGQAAGWVIDPWPEKKIILAWRACAGCLLTAQKPDSMAIDNGYFIKYKSEAQYDEHQGRIAAVNEQKAKIAIAESERRSEELWANHDWPRGKDGKHRPRED